MHHANHKDVHDPAGWKARPAFHTSPLPSPSKNPSLVSLAQRTSNRDTADSSSFTECRKDKDGDGDGMGWDVPPREVQFCSLMDTLGSSKAPRTLTVQVLLLEVAFRHFPQDYGPSLLLTSGLQ